MRARPAMAHSLPMIRVALRVAGRRASRRCRGRARGRSSFTCTSGCASPRSWRTASITLVMPPRLAGWLLQRPPPSVLKGSRPTPAMRLPSATKRAALPLRAEAQVLERDQHRDREAVVDRRVLDVGRRHAGLGEGGRARPGAHPCRSGRPCRPSGASTASPAPSTVTSGRLRLFATSGVVTTMRAAAVADHAAVEPMQRIGDHRRVRRPPRR